MLVMRVAGNKKGNDNDGKSDDDKGGGQATGTWEMATATLTTWAMVMAARLAGNKEGGKSSKVMAMAIRVAGNVEGKGKDEGNGIGNEGGG